MSRKRGVDLSGVYEAPTAPATTDQRGAGRRTALTFRVDDELYEKLSIEATKRRMKKQELIEKAVRRYLAS